MFVALIQYLIWFAVFFASFELPKKGLGFVGALIMLYAFLEVSNLRNKEGFKESDYLKDIVVQFIFPVFMLFLNPASVFPALCLGALALIKVGSISARLIIYGQERRAPKAGKAQGKGF